jgi:hypothetical protein
MLIAFLADKRKGSKGCCQTEKKLSSMVIKHQWDSTHVLERPGATVTETGIVWLEAGR